MEFRTERIITNGKAHNHICIYNGIRNVYLLDMAMSKLLGISYSEYYDIGASYSGTHLYDELVFAYKKDALKFVEYLNNTYLIMIKLQGKI